MALYVPAAPDNHRTACSVSKISLISLSFTHSSDTFTLWVMVLWRWKGSWCCQEHETLSSYNAECVMKAQKMRFVQFLSSNSPPEALIFGGGCVWDSEPRACWRTSSWGGPSQHLDLYIRNEQGPLCLRGSCLPKLLCHLSPCCYWLYSCCKHNEKGDQICVRC